LKKNDSEARRKMHVGGILAAALCGGLTLVTVAVPKAVSTAEFEYRLVDLARVPPAVLVPAIEEVRRLFGRVEIHAAAAALPDLGSGPAAAEACVMPTVFLLGEGVFRSPSPDADALGYVSGAPGAPPAAMVSPQRTTAMARRIGVSPGTLLGHVIAHELAHLLLPGHVHAAALMEPAWGSDELLRVAQGGLAFDPAYAEQLRRRIRDIPGMPGQCRAGGTDTRLEAAHGSRRRPDRPPR
jgi:hypothetical protein